MHIISQEKKIWNWNFIFVEDNENDSGGNIFVGISAVPLIYWKDNRWQYVVYFLFRNFLGVVL